MGNTQSAEAPRRPPTKLTKPRTNTSTSNLLAISSAPSRRSSTLSLPVARNKRSSTVSLVEVSAEEDGPLKSKTGSRSQRRSLFRSKSTQPESRAPVDDRLSDVDTKMNSNPLHRYSSMVSVRVDVMGDAHTGTSNSRPPVRSARSAQPYFQPASQPQRLSLVVEAQSPEPKPREELVQFEMRHGSFDSGVQESAVSPIERSNSPDSLPIPIRRRSLLTPGIATRKTSREKMVRKSLPAQPSSSMSGSTESKSASEKKNFRRTLPAQPTIPQDQIKRYCYDQSMPTSSPLEEIAALESKNFSDLQPRTVTPSDLDYGHIGAFKLGSLRITNGTVSPAPSGPEPSYFDTKVHTQSNSDAAEPTSSDLARKEEEGLPGKVYIEQTGTFVSIKPSQVRFECQEAVQGPPKIVETMVEIPTFSLGLSDFQPSASPGKNIVLQSPKTAYEIAQGYRQEIAASPFSFDESPFASPQLEATTKPTEIEDNLFDDEPGSAVSVAPPVVQKSLLQRSIETQTSFASLVAPPVKVESLQKGSQVSRGPREQPMKPLEKADSGYSSKTSLRSLKSRRSFTEIETNPEPLNLPTLAPVAPAVPNKSPPPTPPKNLYTKYSSEKSIVSSTVQSSKSLDKEYAPATPAKDWSAQSAYGLGEAPGSFEISHQPESSRNDDVPPPPSRKPPPVPQKLPQTSRSGWTGPPPLPIKSIQQTQALAMTSSDALSIQEKPTPIRRQSTPLPPYGQTMRPGLKPSTSDTSISTISRRLQKRSPAAQPRLIVQGFTEIEPDRVPPVSQEESEHLEERLKNFPTLTHTYKSVHRTNSKETLATIFSMASAERQAEEMQRVPRFQGMIPNAPSNEAIELSTKADSIGSSPAPGERFSLMPKILRRSIERQNRRQSLESMNRNRSSSREAEDRKTYIAELGAFSASLGSSPYGLTTTALTPVSGNRSHESPSVAEYERSIAGGRTVGMDSQAAAQFARERSRSRENERRRALRRENYESRNSSEERLFLPFDLRSKVVTDSGPPVPNISHAQAQNYPHPKKTKSPPPVSMRMPRKRMSSPPPNPSKAAPSAPVEIPRVPDIESPHYQFQIKEQRQYTAWQNHDSFFRDVKQPVGENASDAPRPTNSRRPRHNRPPLEEQRQWSSQPLERRPSSEQQRYQSQPTQQSYIHSSLQDRQRGLACQSHDSYQPQRDGRALARASFSSNTEKRASNNHPLGQSHSYTQMRSETWSIDHYNGDFGYRY